MKTKERNDSSVSTRLALILMLALFGLAAVGCQTAEGFGEDMENAGEEIQEGVN